MKNSREKIQQRLAELAKTLNTLSEYNGKNIELVTTNSGKEKSLKQLNIDLKKCPKSIKIFKAKYA